MQLGLRKRGEKMRTSRKFEILRRRMTDEGLDNSDIAKLIGKGIAYVNERMSGSRPWTMEDVFIIMEKLHIAENEMHIFFPKEGNRTYICTVSQLNEREVQLIEAYESCPSMQEAVNKLLGIGYRKIVKSS